MRTQDRHHRGVVMAEAAIVLPTLFMFLIGTITIGMGIFRYQQVAALAREGARYASVHGGQYAQDTGNAAATSATIKSNAILPMAVGLDTAHLSSSVTWSNGNWATSANATGGTQVNTVSVTVVYNWTPERYIVGPIPLSSTSVMPMAY